MAGFKPNYTPPSQVQYEFAKRLTILEQELRRKWRRWPAKSEIYEVAISVYKEHEESNLLTPTLE